MADRPALVVAANAPRRYPSPPWPQVPEGILLCNMAVAAAALRVTEQQLIDLHWDGLVPRPFKLGGRLLFSTNELADWMAAGSPDRATWEHIKAKQASTL